MSQPTAVLDAELNEATTKGQMLDALEQFYHPDCVFEEPGGEKRHGRAAQHAHLSAFFATLRGLDAATLHAAAARDDVTLSEWTFEMTAGDGGSIVWNEVLVRRWRDGRVVSERFYQA